MSSNLYYIDPNQTFEPSRPSPKQNLIELYGLSGLALSVARTNPDGTKGIKLRKSYKSHIADLPGKHNNINTERDISPVVFRPQFVNPNPDANVDPNAAGKQNGQGGESGIKILDMKFLLDKLRFDRTPDTGIPDFDVANLAVSDSSSLKNASVAGGSSSGGVGAGGAGEGSEGKKRKKKGRQNDEDAKRRKLAEGA